MTGSLADRMLATTRDGHTLAQPRDAITGRPLADPEEGTDDGNR